MNRMIFLSQGPQPNHIFTVPFFHVRQHIHRYGDLKHVHLWGSHYVASHNVINGGFQESLFFCIQGCYKVIISNMYCPKGIRDHLVKSLTLQKKELGLRHFQVPGRTSRGDTHGIQLPLLLATPCDPSDCILPAKKHFVFMKLLWGVVVSVPLGRTVLNENRNLLKDL